MLFMKGLNLLVWGKLSRVSTGVNNGYSSTHLLDSSLIYTPFNCFIDCVCFLEVGFPLFLALFNVLVFCANVPLSVNVRTQKDQGNNR